MFAYCTKWRPKPFFDDLEVFGPDSNSERIVTLAEARTYCRGLARTHYENFTVASWFLPKHLRSHFYNIYAFCRWSDDLADEVPESTESLRLLDWWEHQLVDCFCGVAHHPVFVALKETIGQFHIPIDPFRNLLVAFRQDRRKVRYDTFEELLGYCRHSANPVGRIVLHLGGCHHEANLPLSDSICTGLQLANFWQDIRTDYRRGRIYLPLESCRRFGYGEADFERGECNDSFRELMKFEVDRAEQYLLAGQSLVEQVSAELSLDVELFVNGGLAILKAIRRLNYDVWEKRPVVGKLSKIQLMAGAWWRTRRTPRMAAT